jgi:hypothetical protein
MSLLYALLDPRCGKQIHAFRCERGERTLAEWNRLSWQQNAPCTRLHPDEEW